MGADTIDVVIEIPPLPEWMNPEGFKVFWVKNAKEHGASSAYVKLQGKMWRCVAAFATDADGMRGHARLVKFWEERLGKKVGVRAKTESHESAGLDLDEGDVLCAVLFDKHRAPKLTLVRITLEEARKKGAEINAPIIVLIGMQYSNAITPDVWIAGLLFADGYGEPSERIQDQLGDRAGKEVLKYFFEKGITELAKGAGQA
jgi:hypothetical protein